MLNVFGGTGLIHIDIWRLQPNNPFYLSNRVFYRRHMFTCLRSYSKSKWLYWHISRRGYKREPCI